MCSGNGDDDDEIVGVDMQQANGERQRGGPSDKLNKKAKNKRVARRRRDGCLDCARVWSTGEFGGGVRGHGERTHVKAID